VLKKVALFALLFLIGAGVGLFVGWIPSSSRERLREGRQFGGPADRDFLKTYDSIARLWSVNIGASMRLQDPKYGPEGRREYLSLTLDAAQKGKTQVTNPGALTLIDVETGITYVRLAMVEEAAGNLPASQTWMQKAQTTLKHAGWKDCSDAHLKTLVQALNKQDSCDGGCGKH